MSIASSFPMLLYAHRKSQGWTQEEMATHWNYSSDTISSWERGRRTPGIQEIPRLARLLEVDSEELAQCIRIQGRKGQELLPGDSKRTKGNAFETWGELQHIYRNRTEFTRDFSYPRLLETAHHILAVGISLNAIALNYNREKIIEAVVEHDCHYDLCFLDPEGTFNRIREREEAYPPRTLADLTRLNINNITGIRYYISRVAPDRINHLQVRIYDFPPRINVYIVDNMLMTVQLYLYSRGEDTPTFVLRRQTDNGLFDFYASAAKHIFDQATPLKLPEGEKTVHEPEA